MEPSFEPNRLLQQLGWRYATKKFDAQKRLSETQWSTLAESLRLAPSSFGLQPWKFAVVTNAALKEQFVKLSWGQTQPKDCSHFVVLLTRKSIDASYVAQFMQQISKVRNVPLDKLASYQAVILQFIGKLTPEQASAWMTRQAYIALGQLMTSAAMLGIDTCPMEGIDPAGYDELLGLRDSDYTTVVACAVGYRDSSDANASLAKVRFDATDIFLNF